MLYNVYNIKKRCNLGAYTCIQYKTYQSIKVWFCKTIYGNAFQ